MSARISTRYRFLLVAAALLASIVLFGLLDGASRTGPFGAAFAAGPSLAVTAAQEQMQTEPEEPPAPPGDEPAPEAEEAVPEPQEETPEEVTPPPIEPPTTPAPAPLVVPPSSTPPSGSPVPPSATPSVVAPPPANPPATPPATVPAAPSAAVPPPANPIPTVETSKSEAPAVLPADLKKICARIATSPAASDPIVIDYLGRMSGHPTPDDMDDFGVLLGRKYYLKDAEAFLEAATSIDKTNTDYWLNLGTIRLQRGKLSSALVAYEKALKLDPNKAITHYDIGVVHDYMRNYDEAVDAFTRALALDPSLGDPKVNPLAVNNERLLVVNLLLYQAREGGLAMPLRGGPPTPPPPPKPGAADSKKTKS